MAEAAAGQGRDSLVCPPASTQLSSLRPPFPFPSQNTSLGSECSGNHSLFPVASPVFSQHFGPCNELTVVIQCLQGAASSNTWALNWCVYKHRKGKSLIQVVEQ